MRRMMVVVVVQDVGSVTQFLWNFHNISRRRAVYRHRQLAFIKGVGSGDSLDGKLFLVIIFNFIWLAEEISAVY